MSENQDPNFQVQKLNSENQDPNFHKVQGLNSEKQDPNFHKAHELNCENRDPNFHVQKLCFINQESSVCDQNLRSEQQVPNFQGLKPELQDESGAVNCSKNFEENTSDKQRLSLLKNSTDGYVSVGIYNGVPGEKPPEH